MKLKAVLILIAFLFICGFLEQVRNDSIHASEEPSGITERASAQHPNLAPATEDHSSKASVHFEPLLLLLLGSTLFSIGTAIKLILSRKLDPKQLGATRKPPSPQL
jgi:hypothetical protein